MSKYDNVNVIIEPKVPIDGMAGPIEARCEGLWNEVTGTSWMVNSNPATIKFAMRSAMAHLPTDDDVYYVKINGLGHLVHASEIVGLAQEEVPSIAVNLDVST